MKKEYSEIKLEIIKLADSDVITSSGNFDELNILSKNADSWYE